MYVTDVMSLGARMSHGYFNEFLMFMNYLVCNMLCCKSQDVMWQFYLSLSSGEFTNTSSHISDCWYLPMFLFMDGSLTLMKIHSLIDLTRFYSSLPTMLKLSTAVV